jgi:hypothetical protein
MRDFTLLVQRKFKANSVGLPNKNNYFYNV